MIITIALTAAVSTANGAGSPLRSIFAMAIKGGSHPSKIKRQERADPLSPQDGAIMSPLFRWSALASLPTRDSY
jgi:hypothetical protein